MIPDSTITRQWVGKRDVNFNGRLPTIGTTMNIFDPIYGHWTLHEPVLHDLLMSDAVKRLHGVLQHGITGLVGITAPISRYDHSLGAMLLVRQLGGSLAEQIAALLHDVSHTAFSHVIDYVFDDHDGQSYHDEKKAWYVAQTDLPAILHHHGFGWRELVDEARFPLLEQPSPRLCADRLDYFLRDAEPLGLATAAEIAAVLADLVVVNGRIATQTIATARWLGETFMAADDASWSNFREVGLYELTARAIRRGLSLGVVSEADLWQTDAVLWQKLHAANDWALQELLVQVSPATRFVWDEVAPTFWVSTKLRAIDPDVVGENGRLLPLSTLDPGFARRRQYYLQSKAGKWPMRVDY
ncbi:MAG: HD domain-containing protein [Anaerolineales bacterium]|nr:HD domain-containing protein [Anaerolineales bacterium]